MGVRRQGREWALRALVLLDCNPELPVEEAVRRLAEMHAADPRETWPVFSDEARLFGEDLVRGAWARRDAIDDIIRQHSVAWRLERMAVVDRNILRLALYEIVFLSVPKAIVIDEAVELARRYGAEGSTAFVNGILDKVAGQGEA